MTKKELESELSKINERRKDLEYDFKECKERRDRPQQDRIKKELRVLSNRAKHILFKLGKYRYPEGEAVEYESGEFMDANIYHWLRD